MFIKHPHIWLSFTTAACMIALGVIVLLGWQFDNEFLYSVIHELPPMVPNTALGFIFSGASVWLLSGREGIPYRIYAGQLLALCSSLIGVITIIEYLNIMPMISIDRLLVPIFSQEPFVLRPSPHTAIAFSFSGTALFLLGFGKTQLTLLIQWLSLLVLMIAIAVFFGYIYGDVSFYAYSDVIGMAVHTAIGFILLVLGILMATHETGLMRIITSNTAGGIIMRRLLPSIVLIPLILGWLVTMARKAGLETEQFGTALLQSLSVIVMTIIVARVAVIVNREERLKQRAEEMARQHKADLTHLERIYTISEMAVGIAHEINQPLVAISHYASACKRRLSNQENIPQDVMQSLEMIVSSTKLAAATISPIQAFVRKQTPKKSYVVLNDLISMVVNIIEHDLRSNNVQLKILISEQLPKIEVDAILIEQVLLNIIRNSIEALQAENVIEKDITISAYVNKNHDVQIDICDSGQGLDEKTLSHVFESFFTTKGSKGMGMGLSICKSIIEAHGGLLWAKSSQGQGICFSFNLPMQG